MGELRTGFTEYEQTYKYSENFINDVNLLIDKTYKKWTLYEDYEEFKSSCWTKVVSSLEWYDSEDGRDYGRLSPFIHQVVWNEATRLYSKHKRMSCKDISSPDFKEDNYLFIKDYDRSNLSLRCKIHAFACEAYSMGVYINQVGLYKNYLLGNSTPLVKVFMWGTILSGKGGDYIGS